MVAESPTLSIEGDRVRMPASAWQHGGFRAWVTSDELPDDVRVAFIEGEVFVEMSPDSIESHKVKTAVTTTLERIAHEEDLGEVYSDRALLTHQGAELSTEPDAIFASWSAFESGRLELVPKGRDDADYIELVGAPDLVVEVVSDSSERKDLVRLRGAYARAGIPEYWLIDARGPELRFEILVLEGGTYRDPPAGASSQHSPALGRRFSLRRERNRLGRWRYHLEASAIAP